jgi:methyl-accepting chemotaxis protein
MRQRGRAAIELAGKAIATSEQVATSSHRALEESLAEIDRIRTHVGQLAARVEELESRADPLARVVETLSISAAQEAVVLDRAPATHGRAALGGIVGELRAQSREAQRAASTARRSLAEVQHAIRRARSAAEEGSRAVETSSARTRTQESSLEQRGTTVRDISRALRQLADLIQEQLERIEQIFEGVENVRRATAHFNQAADQTLGTARGLTRLSAEMKEILASFRLR